MSNPPRRLNRPGRRPARPQREAGRGHPGRVRGHRVRPCRRAPGRDVQPAVENPAADRLAAGADAARALLVAGHVPGQRRTGHRHRRLETVGGDCGRGRRLRPRGGLVRRPDPGRVDGGMEPQVPRGPRTARRPRHPGEGREHDARSAAPAGGSLQRRAVVEARPVVPAVRPADPPARARAPRGRRDPLGRHRADLAAGRRQVLHGPAGGVRPDHLVDRLPDARVRRPPRGVRPLPGPRPARAGRRPLSAARRDAGLPVVPAAVAARAARPRPGPRRAAGRAVGRPHPAVPRQLLRDDDRLPARGGRRDRGTTGGSPSATVTAASSAATSSPRNGPSARPTTATTSATPTLRAGSSTSSCSDCLAARSRPSSATAGRPRWQGWATPRR